MIPVACKKQPSKKYTEANTSLASDLSVSDSTSSDTNIQQAGLGLVDGSTLGTPSSEVTKTQICKADVYQISVNNFDKRTGYFEFKFCDPNNPQTCKPDTSDGIEPTFNQDVLQIPNLLDGVSQATIQMRPCVRTYDARNPAKNCSDTWTTLSAVPPLQTKKEVATALWQTLVGQRKLTEQCWKLRKAFEDFQYSTQGTKVDPTIAKIVSAGLLVGVDACQNNVENGMLETLESELQGLGHTDSSSTKTEPATAQASANASASSNDSSGPNVGMGVGIGIGVAAGIFILGAAVVAYQYKQTYNDLSDLKKLGQTKTTAKGATIQLGGFEDNSKLEDKLSKSSNPKKRELANAIREAKNDPKKKAEVAKLAKAVDTQARSKALVKGGLAALSGAAAGGFAGVISAFSSGNVMGLADISSDPKTNLLNTLTDIRNQIIAIKGELDTAKAQLQTCTFL